MTQETQLPQDYEQLQQQYPKEAQILQTVVTRSVLDVEHHNGDLPGAQKAKMAEEQAVDLLNKALDGASLALPIDPGVKALLRCLIPLIPGLINGTVELFHQIGEFVKGGAKGVS